ncbi:MAG: helix-turn-helix domain-containing protein, partial [Pseudomonadota bacterium]
MARIEGLQAVLPHLPLWVPQGAKHYLAHTEAGLPIRELARKCGCHASTILRQVRRF